MKTETACGVCAECRQRRVNDFVGRMLAEQAISAWSCTLTLTYAPRDDLADKVIHPPHFQKFVRALRRRGHNLRYFVAGEYGDLRGRAHFHAILFGQGPRPNWDMRKAVISYPGEIARWKEATRKGPVHWPQESKFHMTEWPHGNVSCDWGADERAFRYTCKYLLKNDRGTYWCSMSKKPPLGAEWFARLAERNISLGVLPASFEYLPPGGKPGQKYLMQGATRRDFLLAMIDGWEARGGDLSDARMNEWVRNRVNKVLQDRYKKDHEEDEEEKWIEQLVVRLDKARPSEASIASRVRWEDYQQETRRSEGNGQTEERQD